MGVVGAVSNNNALRGPYEEGGQDCCSCGSSGRFLGQFRASGTRGGGGRGLRMELVCSAAVLERFGVVVCKHLQTGILLLAAAVLCSLRVTGDRT